MGLIGSAANGVVDLSAVVKMMKYHHVPRQGAASRRWPGCPASAALDGPRRA